MAAAVSVESGITGTDLARIATAVSVNSGVSVTGLIDPGMDAVISVYSGVSETSLTGDSIGGIQVMDETARERCWNGPKNLLADELHRKQQEELHRKQKDCADGEDRARHHKAELGYLLTTD